MACTLEMGDLEGFHKVVILSMDGQIVFSAWLSNAESKTAQINIDGFAEGAYLVQLTSDGGQIVAMKKLIGTS